VSYGPVGSLEKPGGRGGYSLFDADGIRVWVSAEVLESMDDPESLTFDFGRFGRCGIRFARK